MLFANKLNRFRSPLLLLQANRFNPHMIIIKFPIATTASHPLIEIAETSNQKKKEKN